jgi:shikimate dehydrogenase
MIHLGLIGYPLGHSLSPRIHSAALRACGLAGDYSLFPIQPDDKKSLQNLLTRVCSGEITGLNVTIPHKQYVIPLLDILTESAAAIGAVNTIYLRNNRLIGDNTDAPGFLVDLRKFLTESPSPVGAGQSRSVEEGIGVRKKQALVLGAGGSARAIVYALLKDGWIVILAARRIEQAQQLAYSFANYELSITDNNLSNIDLSHIALIVNATPVGMSPNTDRSPWPENLSFPRHAAIYDLVYNPRETKLMIDAQAQGLSAITGLGMLIEQAALAFELWTGKQVSREIMFPAVEES